MRINFVFFIFLWIVASSCSVSKKIEKDLKGDDIANNFFRGLVVYNPETKKTLINYNGNKYFTPASNTKLFTFYTAYKTFKDSVTGLKYIQKGDSLIIKGNADPSFLYGFKENKTLSFLKNVSQSIYLIDENIAESSFGLGWAWDDYSYFYMPEKSIFPIYGNIINLSKWKDSIQVYPNFFKESIRIDDQKKIWRERQENIFYLNSSKDTHEKLIPFTTSNQLVADLLSSELGKKVTLIPNGINYKFKDFKSIKYDSLYKEMLEVSDNFIAEHLMLQVGNEVDSSFSVEKAIAFSLKNYLPDIPQKPRWVDGSGLSRYNLFTPESIVYLLELMYHDIPKDKLFMYLPVEGKSGTLKTSYKTVKPFIYAKSGTLSNNYNLSGYLITKKGRVLIFSYMNNHYQGSSSLRKGEMQKVFLKLHENY